jgi:hypothetical protein
MRAIALLAAVVCAVAGCSDHPNSAELSTAPQATGDALPGSEVRAVPSIAGTWTWSEEVDVVLHPDDALAFGITPEGESTQATCVNSGTITFEQDGATFEGIATQPNGVCRTTGGQEFSNVFPEPFPVFEGRITGNTIHFGFSSPDCPYQAVLVLEAGEAVSASGQGNCNLPQLVFHSQWEASR